MKRLFSVALFVLLFLRSCVPCPAQTQPSQFNATWNFNSILANFPARASMDIIALSPIGATTNQFLIPFSASSLLVSNGVVTVSNIFSGYKLKEVLTAGGYTYCLTNYFTNGTTGTVNALNYTPPGTNTYFANYMTGLTGSGAATVSYTGNGVWNVNATGGSGTNSGGGYPITNTDGTITITTSGGMTNLSATPVLTYAAGVSNLSAALQVRALTNASAFDASGAAAALPINTIGVTNTQTGVTLGGAFTGSLTGIASGNLTPTGNGAALTGITAAQVGAVATNSLQNVWVMPWLNEPASVTNDPTKFGPWLGPNYPQLAVNSLTNNQAFNNEAGGCVHVIGTNVFPSTILITNASMSNNVSITLLADTFLGGALICQTNPCIRVQAPGPNTTIQFTMRNLIVSSLTNQCTNLVEILGGVSTFNVTWNEFGWLGNLTNNQIQGLAGFTPPTFGTGFKQRNLIGIYINDSYNDQCTISENNFQACNFACYIISDHVLLDHNFCSYCGAPNDWPQSAVNYIGCAFGVFGGLGDVKFHDNYFFGEYNGPGTNNEYSYLATPSSSDGLSQDDVYEGCGGIVFTNGSVWNERFSVNINEDFYASISGGVWSVNAIGTNNGYYGGHHISTSIASATSGNGFSLQNFCDQFSDYLGPLPWSTNIAQLNGNSPLSASKFTGSGTGLTGYAASLGSGTAAVATNAIAAITATNVPSGGSIGAVNAASMTNYPFTALAANGWTFSVIPGIGNNVLMIQPAQLSSLSGTYGFGTNGTLTALGFAGSGANLTALPAAQLTGTVPAANLSSLVLTNWLFTNSTIPVTIAGNWCFVATNLINASAGGGSSTTNYGPLTANQLIVTNGVVLTNSATLYVAGAFTNVGNVGIGGTLTAPASASIATSGTLTTSAINSGSIKATTLAANSSGSLVSAAGNLQYFGGQSFIEACGNGTIEGNFAIDCALSTSGGIGVAMFATNAMTTYVPLIISSNNPPFGVSNNAVCLWNNGATLMVRTSSSGSTNYYGDFPFPHIETGTTNATALTSFTATFTVPFSDTNYVATETGNGIALAGGYVSNKTTNNCVFNMTAATGNIDWICTHR